MQEDEEIQSQSRKKSLNYVKGANNGKWSKEEHKSYVCFIDFNKNNMRSKQRRRSNKFYQRMSEFIGKRNPLQCRSHHQKLQQKYGCFSKIISHQKLQFDQQVAQFVKQQAFGKQNQCSQIQQNCFQEIGVQTDLQGIQNNLYVYPQPNYINYNPIPFPYIFNMNPRQIYL